MSENWLERETSLIGENAVIKLQNSSVAVFGIGGVGSFTVEALARSGIGSLILIDGDRVSLSNINRQLIADRSTVGLWKAEVAASRIAHINPECKVTAINIFVDESNIDEILSKSKPDFIVDAIDSVRSKLLIARWAVDHNVPIISSMGTGNKLDPSKFTITDISKTSVCPLARVMRRELKAMGISHIPVLFSTEEPVKIGSRTPASISYVPSSAGLMIAGYVIRSIIS
jgi:tRNA A37 threonylcarbamoyladenosine dehydratase